MKVKIYLDDVRTPINPDWIVVRNYDDFVKTVTKIGLENIDIISLDHDLGDSAMEEFYSNVYPNGQLNYENIKEKTGYDCAKWLINHYYDNFSQNREKMSSMEKRNTPINFPQVYTHSANPVGASNIMGYINNFLMRERQEQSCVRVKIDHTQ